MRKIRYGDKFIKKCRQVYPHWTDLHQLLAAGDVDGVGALLSSTSDCGGLLDDWYRECLLQKNGTSSDRFVRQVPPEPERTM